MNNTLLRCTFATSLAIASVGAATVARAQIQIPPEVIPAPKSGPDPRQLTDEQFNLFQEAVNEERLELQGANLLTLDPNSLFSDTGFDPIDIFFINEGASFRSSLEVSINGSSRIPVFDDIASPESILPEASGPLWLGEGRRLGSATGETSLQFFIDTNGDAPGGNVYGANAANNPDGLQHVVAQEFEFNGESIVLIGFEDLFGPLGATGGQNQDSDRDFNDVVFAVRGVAGTPIVGDPDPDDPSVPEPASAIALLGVAAFGAAKLRRQKS